MISRAAILGLAGLLLPLGLTAQEASLVTGGGVGRFDQYPSGALGTLGLDVSGKIGALALALDSRTTSFQDIGTSSTVRGNLRLDFNNRQWRASIGPMLEVGRAVQGEWNDAWGGRAAVERRLGPVILGIDLAEGITHPRSQRVSFGRRGASAGLNLGPVTLTSTIDITVLRDSTLRDDVFLSGNTGSAPDSLFRSRVRSISDVAFALLVELPTMSIDATVGRRSGDDVISQGWWRVHATIPITAVASIRVGTSRNPADLVLGIPGERATTLGLRVAIPDGNGQPPLAVPVVVERNDGQRVRIILTLPGGSSAKLMGEFTGWRPVSLEPLGGGRFAASFFAQPGTYRINVALDGGPWIAPPGMPRIEDGFGGLVGLLTL